MSFQYSILLSVPASQYDSLLEKRAELLAQGVHVPNMPEPVPDSFSQYEYESRADTFSCKDGHFTNAPEYVFDEENDVFVIKVEPDSDSDTETNGQSIADDSSESSFGTNASTIYNDTIPTAASTVGVNADHHEANYSILLTRRKTSDPPKTGLKIMVQSGTFQNYGVVV